MFGVVEAQRLEELAGALAKTTSADRSLVKAAADEGAASSNLRPTLSALRDLLVLAAAPGVGD